MGIMWDIYQYIGRWSPHPYIFHNDYCTYLKFPFKLLWVEGSQYCHKFILGLAPCFVFFIAQKQALVYVLSVQRQTCLLTISMFFFFFLPVNASTGIAIHLLISYRMRFYIQTSKTPISYFCYLWFILETQKWT